MLIISGQNSYEHDWTGVNNMLRTQLQDTGRFDVRVTEDFDHAQPRHAQGLRRGDAQLFEPLELHRRAAARVVARCIPGALRLRARGRRASSPITPRSPGAATYPEYKRLVGAVMEPGSSRRSPPGAFPVHLIDRTHPITQGMREFVWTYNDDMYTNMSFDPAAKIHVLATAHDSSASYDPKLTGPKYPPAAYTRDKLAEDRGWTPTIRRSGPLITARAGSSRSRSATTKSRCTSSRCRT